jgi:isopenicillin-N N-acyltransferase-like protein
MLSHADGDCMDLECTPDEAFWLQQEGGLLPHSNHFLSTPARCRIVDTYFPRAADTLYRWSRVRDSLAPKVGKIEYRDLVEALSDRFGFPDSVLRSPKPAVFDAISATVSMTIIDAKVGKMWLARKPYERIDFAEYSVSADTEAKPVTQLAA